ncbi:MAG: hypothetical protein JWQ07_4790 [Ramlibacter sp.]|nr:hypothetical protein [Ramlibacter sp.]
MSLALSRQQTCHRAAAGHAPALHPVVQGARRQRAARAAPPLPLGQRCAPLGRLAAGRSRERMRKAETEGQIKGVARRAPPIQSARGFAAAPQGVLRVPRRGWNPHCSGDCRVPFPMRCTRVRWGLHGWQ